MNNNFSNLKSFNIESNVKENSNKFIIFFQGFTKEDNHLVAPSPWPLLTAEAAFGVVVSLTAFMHNYLYSPIFYFFHYLL